LGTGADGVVFKVCKGSNNTNCNYALKIQKISRAYYAEAYGLADLEMTNTVPEIYENWTCNRKGLIIMDYIPSCKITNFTDKVKRYENAFELLRIIKNKGWIHVDMHLGNVRCKDGDVNKLVLIDLGWAVKKRKGKYPDHPLSKRWSYNLNYKELTTVANYNFIKNFYDKSFKNHTKYVPNVDSVNKRMNMLRKKIGI
jgi:hypothetical protein